MEGSYLSLGGNVTWRRLLLRVAVLCVALVLLDRAVAATLPAASVYLDSYRLPRLLPTSAISDYALSIESAAAASRGKTTAVFLGASPTWGDAIRDRRHTVPYAFESAATSAGVPLQAFNLASNGQFVGDQYIIAKRLADDAGLVMVELTYHTFNPAARSGKVVRYAELPRLLGVGLSPRERRLLGIESGESAGASTVADRFLSANWLLWRQRDRLDRKLFGGKPRQALDDAVGKLLRRGRAAPDTLEDADETDGGESPDAGFTSFDALDPGKQMIVVARYSEDSAFEIDPADAEVRVLSGLAGLLESRHKKAIFFMTPLNRDLVSEYELIDPKQYARNVSTIRRVVESKGYRLIDYNAGPAAVAADQFADVSHTTDEGGQAFGARLYRDTSAYLQAVTR